MNTFTDIDIYTSYTTLALLDVCTAAATFLEGQPSSAYTTALCGSLILAIRHAKQLAGQTHDVLETIQREEARSHV